MDQRLRGDHRGADAGSERRLCLEKQGRGESLHQPLDEPAGADRALWLHRIHVVPAAGGEVRLSKRAGDDSLPGRQRGAAGSILVRVRPVSQGEDPAACLDPRCGASLYLPHERAAPAALVAGDLRPFLCCRAYLCDHAKCSVSDAI